MKYFLFLMLGIVSILVVPKLWAEDMTSIHMEHEQALQATAPAETAGHIEDAGNTICPVMGGQVDKNINYAYEGKRYYFCCPMCVQAFKSDPQRYIKKLEEQQGAEKQAELDAHK